MSYTTFSQVHNDQLKEPMFFGQPCERRPL